MDKFMDHANKEEALRLARGLRKLLNNPKNWTQGAFARDARGANFSGVEIYSEAAVCWCEVGGLIKEAHGQGASNDTFNAVRNAMNATLPDNTDAMTFNDDVGRHHVEILAHLDDVIRFLEAQ